jgi:hypothetical protein
VVLEECELNGGVDNGDGGGRASNVNEKVCVVNLFGYLEECSQLPDSELRLKKREEYDKKIAQAFRKEAN